MKMAMFELTRGRRRELAKAPSVPPVAWSVASVKMPKRPENQTILRRVAMMTTIGTRLFSLRKVATERKMRTNGKR